MTQDPNLYSTIRGDAAPRPADEYSMYSLYDQITHPRTIVVLLSAYFAWFNRDLFEYAVRASNGDVESVLHLLLVGLALAVGIRVIHSIYLAKRDYRQLESGFGDVLLFLFVVIFTSGGLVYLLKGRPHAILWVYSAGALVATVNFITLYHVRIPNIATTCDYPFERRIQAVNCLVFAAITVMLVRAATIAGHPNPEMSTLYWLVGASIGLLTLNVLHSEQLSMYPKFLMHNRVDNLSKLIEVLRSSCGAMLAGKTDEELMAFFRDLPPPRQQIHTVRARRTDSDLISHVLQAEFPYMFAYLFKTAESNRITRGIRTLLTVAGGLGSFGWMHFYFICNESGERVGLFKIETARSVWLYRPFEWIAMPIYLLLGLRLVNVAGFIHRVRLASAGQGAPEVGDLRLTYLVIFPEYQHQGYGSSFLRLLEAAHLINNTNYVVARRIVLGVREFNSSARRLFEEAGYTYVTTRISSTKPDPFSGHENPGALLSMERTLGKPQPVKLG